MRINWCSIRFGAAAAMAALALLTAPPAVVAQEATTGVIEGRVIDAQGARPAENRVEADRDEGHSARQPDNLYGRWRIACGK